MSKSDLFRGLRLSLLTQVPYQAVLLSSFKATDDMMTSAEKYHRYDDGSFLYKFFTRFGSVTISTTLAFLLCYPFDTVKRRMQAEGSPGYSYTNTHNEVEYARGMLKTEGLASFYRGFVPGLTRTVPMCFI